MAEGDGGAAGQDNGGAIERRIGDGGGVTDAGVRRRRLMRSLCVVVLHLALLGVAVALAWSAYDGPGQTRCPALLADDDVVHLPLRDARAQEAQLARWRSCDAEAASDARRSVERESVLVLVIGAAFVVAFARVFRWRRWRLAAVLGGALAATFVLADLAENDRLVRLLRTGRGDGGLPWLASVKFGALGGALPLFLLSLADAIGKAFVARDRDLPTQATDERGWWARVFTEPDAGPSEPRVPPLRQRASSFIVRWFRRLTTEPKPARIAAAERRPVDGGGLGVCCSGGGIRSAAFNLGALQALEERTAPKEPGTDEADEKKKSELDTARWISAVSGGSYIAAAWVTARAAQRRRRADPDKAKRAAAVDEIPTWSRRSPEEDHLRRNASYMAPGLGGKLWALARFLFGFALNIGVIALVLGVVFLPYGWVVHRYEQGRSVDVDGVVDLPRGGCLLLSDGRTVAALPGTDLRLAAPPAPTLASGTAAEKPSKPGEPRDAALTIKEGDETVAEAKVSGTGAAGAVAEMPGGGQAVGGVVIGGSTPSASSPPTTVPTTTTCPATALAPPRAGGVPADAPNNTLPAGTRVQLRIDDHLSVRGEALACDISRSIPPRECLPADAERVPVTTGSRLVGAPEVFLTVDEAVSVIGRGVLGQACGGTACAEFERPELVRYLVLVPLGLASLLGIAMVIARTTKGTARRSERWCRHAAAFALGAWVIGFVLPWLVVWTENGRWGIEHRLRLTSSTGTLAVLAALLAQLAPFIGARGSSAGGTDGTVVSLLKKLGRRLRRVAIGFAGAVVGPLVVLVVAIGFASYAAQQQWGAGQLGLWLALVGPLGLLLSGADLNEWSLHPYYRDRLRSAFAVDPRLHPPGDPREDLLEDLPADGTPQLLICAAVNIADDRVTAPGRPVASWIFTRDEIGSRAMAKAPAAEGAAGKGVVEPGCLPNQYKHLTWTWTAVAVSGAAFSPAMGKMSRPERFLLALGNLRLGVWYPNPRYLADDEERWWYRRHHPRPWYLAKEALGLHRADDRWVYVTDGGHYENLGLLELVQRGCCEIYCFDASGDTADTFGTIADAMRLAREEMGIEIRFTPSEAMKPDKSGVSRIAVWAGTVHYTEENVGWIVVAKLAVPASAPFDVVDLARTLPSFPNHPTADQLYTDQKFEAYRALGHHLGEQAALLAADIRRFLDMPGMDHVGAVAKATQRLAPPSGATEAPSPAGAPQGTT